MTHPSSEQIEAAARMFDPGAFAQLSANIPDADRAGLEATKATLQRLARAKARAALVAAAGVTPQEPGEASRATVAKAARVLHVATCCNLDEASEHQEPQNEDLFTAGVVLNSVPLAAPSQVDEARLTGMILGRTAPAAARAIAEWLRGGGQ